MLAWGSDTLTFEASDLVNFRKWTANRPDWPTLFKHHHALRPMKRGKPTFHLVAQKQGEHGFRRVDALDALAEGLHGKIPMGWQPADENAWLEIWLTIRGQTATCGLRLSDRTMRHRTYKTDHVLASLRPTVAASMVRLAGIAPGMTVLDPCCGAGTLLAETRELAETRRYQSLTLLGGDIDPNAVFVAGQNLDNLGGANLCRWDATELPLAEACVDRVLCNPPFGVQLATPDEIGPLYVGLVRETHRVLRDGGKAVFVVGNDELLQEAIKPWRWTPVRKHKVRILGQPAVVSAWERR